MGRRASTTGTATTLTRRQQKWACWVQERTESAAQKHSKNLKPWTPSIRSQLPAIVERSKKKNVNKQHHLLVRTSHLELHVFLGSFKVTNLFFWGLRAVYGRGTAAVGVCAVISANIPCKQKRKVRLWDPCNEIVQKLTDFNAQSSYGWCVVISVTLDTKFG